MITREQLLTPIAPVVQKVDAPELGVDQIVYVRQMTAGERDSFELLVFKAREAGAPFLDNSRAKLAVRTLCDETGKRLLTDEDEAAIAAQPCPLIDRVFAAARQLNKLNQADVDDAVKN